MLKRRRKITIIMVALPAHTKFHTPSVQEIKSGDIILKFILVKTTVIVTSLKRDVDFI